MKFLPKTISNKNIKSNFLTNLPSFSNIATFTSFGQTWTVPSGVSIIWVKLWGAGGAGSGATGGGGGFISGYIKTRPGEKFWIQVGEGGGNEDIDAECEIEPLRGFAHVSYGGGGSRIVRGAQFGAGSSDTTPYVQIYGGPQEIGRFKTNTFAIAGGGGGGRDYNGGAGGGLIAQSGSGFSAGYGGGGAIDTIGGSAGLNNSRGYNAYTASIVNEFGNNIGDPSINGSVAPGAVFTQPASCGQDSDIIGSGGGSGYAGGGGGAQSGGASFGGGGGGSSFLSKDWLLLNVSGSGGTVANNSDADYSAGKGSGGTNANGGDGYVIIRY